MFRFTIRDVLWLTALVAMSGAWWADRRARDQEVRVKIDRIHTDYEALVPGARK